MEGVQSCSVIKPYGRSIVKKGNAEQRKREIIRRKGKKPEDAEPITRFVESHDEVMIAQWISVIDKIIAKPKDVKKPKQSDRNDKKTQDKQKQYDPVQKTKRLRKILGDAAWKKLLQKLAGTEKEKKKIKKYGIGKLKPLKPKSGKI